MPRAYRTPKKPNRDKRSLMPEAYRTTKESKQPSDHNTNNSHYPVIEQHHRVMSGICLAP
jgi:hypothetical protein